MSAPLFSARDICGLAGGISKPGILSCAGYAPVQREHLCHRREPELQSGGSKLYSLIGRHFPKLSPLFNKGCRNFSSFVGLDKGLECAVSRVDENDVLRITPWRIDR